MKPNIAVPNNHILILSYLCTTVQSKKLYLETGLNLTLPLYVLCQNIHFKILRIFLIQGIKRNMHFVTNMK